MSQENVKKKKEDNFSIINDAKEKINLNKNIEKEDKKSLVDDETNDNKAKIIKLMNT